MRISLVIWPLSLSPIFGKESCPHPCTVSYQKPLSAVSEWNCHLLSCPQTLPGQLIREGPKKSVLISLNGTNFCKTIESWPAFPSYWSRWSSSSPDTAQCKSNFEISSVQERMNKYSVKLKYSRFKWSHLFVIFRQQQRQRQIQRQWQWQIPILIGNRGEQIILYSNIIQIVEAEY